MNSRRDAKRPGAEAPGRRNQGLKGSGGGVAPLGGEQGGCGAGEQETAADLEQRVGGAAGAGERATAVTVGSRTGTVRTGTIVGSGTTVVAEDGDLDAEDVVAAGGGEGVGAGVEVLGDRDLPEKVSSSFTGMVPMVPPAVPRRTVLSAELDLVYGHAA
jgi:hypothetical protein